MIPLQKDGTLPAGFDCRRQNGAGVFQRPLHGIAYFRTGDLKDNRSHIPFDCGAKYGLSHMVGDAPDIYSRNGKSCDVFLAHGLIEGLN